MGQGGSSTTKAGSGCQDWQSLSGTAAPPPKAQRGRERPRDTKQKETHRVEQAKPLMTTRGLLRACLPSFPRWQFTPRGSARFLRRGGC